MMETAALYVELKPAGKYYKALCPFHTEKTPSFFVNPEKDTFTCYGCNKFGDIFTLVQEIENISFPEAMNFLIEKFNVPVEKISRQRTTDTDVYTNINDIALKYFRDNLYDSPEGKKALQYLDQRGIGQETIQLFSLGYAENKWDGLYNYLKEKSCDINKAEELGLVIRNPRKNSIYDRFRGRIIFPIFSESGVLIAFGGRTIVNDSNKYLNSPDTPLYKKSNHLYGFNQAKQAIRENKYSILVEGYFDVVSLYQNGVKNIVASLGTALTEHQIYLLKRFSSTIYIYYDSDKAGIAAAIRAIEKMFEQNINPNVIANADAKDPDDFIREKGLKAFNQLISHSKDGFQFLINHIAQDYDLKMPEEQSQAIKKIMNFVDKFNEPIIKDGYKRMVADFFRVDEKHVVSKTRTDLSGKKPVKRLVITPAERIFLQSVLAMPALIEKFKGVLIDKVLSALASRNIIRLLIQNYNPHTKELDDYGKILEQLSEPEQVEFMNIFDTRRNIGKEKTALDQEAESSVSKLIDIFNKQEFRRIDQRIKIAERENNIEEVLRLMKEKNKYIKDKYNKNTGGTVEIFEQQ
jgi:DNA primase